MRGGATPRSGGEHAWREMRPYLSCAWSSPGAPPGVYNSNCLHAAAGGFTTAGRARLKQVPWLPASWRRFQTQVPAGLWSVAGGAIATMWLLRTFLNAVLAMLPLAAPAGVPQSFASYSHQRWIEGSGAPAPVLAMAQGPNDFLWLATGEGLFRFDGIRFERIEAENGAGKHDLPGALLVTKDGDVWTSLEPSHRFAVYRQGALRILDAPPASSRIIEMVEGADGAIWALTANFDAEALRFRDGQWKTFNAADGIPLSNASNMLVADDGALWIACGDDVVRLAPGADRFETYRKGSSGFLSRDLEGRIWLSGSRGSYPVTGPDGNGAPASLRAPYDTGDALGWVAPLFDREGNLWIGTRYSGVRRLATPAARLESGGGGTFEPFTSHDGLSSDVINHLLEDREGNIWVGTERGLDKFQPATLISAPELSSPAVFGDKLLEASDGSVYIGEARTIFRVSPGGAPEPILRNVVEPQSLCEAPDGAIWIGFSGRIVVWANGGVRRTIERPDRNANHNIIYDCAFDAAGNFWISAAGGGVWRYGSGRWQAVLAPGDRFEFYPSTLIRSPSGGVVVQAGDKLVWIDGSGRQSSTRLDFGGSGLAVLTLYATGGDVYAAGAFGVSRFRGEAHVETVPADPASPGSRINGMVQTPEGDVWLAYPRALVRFRSRDFERAFSDRALPPPAQSLGFGDGLVSRPNSHSQRSMVRGGDGRLWVATETGTLWMDPARIVRNTRPPGIAIKSIVADGRAYQDPSTLELPADTTNIEIDFSVLSFTDPVRVRARYMLEGFDRDWIDPDVRRQAFYTNLPPGDYRFRVTGANDDGVWNRSGAALEFRIPPTFFQSAWFPLLCAALALVALGVAYRLRVAQIARRIHGQLEERARERERIARELHDTLLQGVQGVILRFQAVADRMAHDAKSHEQFEAALAAADGVVVDARNRVRDLRGAEGSNDLCLIVEHLVADVPFDPPIPVRIVVEGHPRLLHPSVAEETKRIVREALFNIGHHARASSAEVAIGFESRHLAVRVRDDGAGIPAEVLAHGHKVGHFGMIGMRERAEKIGGSLAISSSPGVGSEVMLTLPAKLAFAKRRPSRRTWLPRFMRRSSADE